MFSALMVRMMNKTLIIVVVSLIGLYGYSYLKNGSYDVKYKDIKKWRETSDNFLEVYRQVKLQNTVAAQSFLEETLRDEVKEGSEYKGSVMDKKDSGRRDKLIKIVDEQTDKINYRLNHCCER